VHNYEGLDRPGGFERSGLLAPLKLRNFRLLWTGMTVSLLGDGVFVVAVAWQSYELSNSPFALSLVMLAMTVPHVLFLLIGGVVSDRWDRRRLMLAADLTRGLVVAVVGVLSLTGSLTLGWLSLLTAVYGAGTAFFGPAFDSIVPDVVPRPMLGQANSLDQLVKPLALRIAGPALGGFMIGIGDPGHAFVFDALTFGASAVAVAAMQVDPGGRREEATSLRRDLVDGLSYVRSHVWLWGTFAAAAVAYLLFMGPVEVLLPFIVKEEMGRSAGDLGFIFAFGGVGSIAAAFLLGSRGLPKRTLTFIYVAWTLSTLTIAGYGIARSVWYLLIPSFLFNFFESAGTIVWATLKQRNVPASLLGRVSSLDWLISIGLLPMSFALTGPVATLLGERPTLVAAGLAGAVVTLSALFLPGMRRIERFPTLAGQELVPESA
jgi:DHA3 family tetracycline resistance protein-like MFS transporter